LPHFHGQKQITRLRFEPACLGRAVAGKVEPKLRCHLHGGWVRLASMRGRDTTGRRDKATSARRNVRISASANVPPTNENKPLDLAYIIRGPLANTGPLLRIGEQQPHQPARRAVSVIDHLRHDGSSFFSASA